MTTRKIWIIFYTIARTEITRFFRVWSQTLLAPVVTTTLYYVIFGKFIGSQVAPIAGFTYIQYIVPGLVMMTVIMSSFQNTVSSFFMAKMMKFLEELLVAPVHPIIVVAGYVMGGVARGLVTGLIVLLVALFFTHLSIFNLGLLLMFVLLTSIFFSLFGLVVAIYAKNFDAVSIIPNFVLTPLTYLGGVFYSISMLPVFWQKVSHANPVFYMINGFRYGFLGVNDTSIWVSGVVLIVMCTGALLYTLYLFQSGRALRT
jgi:ABC-2 type transport system permease protein